MQISNYGRPIIAIILLIMVSLQACTVAIPAEIAVPSNEDGQTTAAENIAAMNQEPVQLKVVTLPFITFAPYYIAIDEGYFAEQNLEIELVNMQRQEEILPALSSGQVDVSSGLVSVGILNAIARGAPIKITADKGYVDPEGCINYALIGRNDLLESGEIKSVADLAGRKINVVPATWLEFYMAEILAQAGLTLDDIEKTNFGATAVPEALEQKTVDLVVNSEPWVTRFKGSGHLPVLNLPQEILPNADVAIQVYGPSMLGENAEVGTRFMTAYLKAVRQYQEGKTERNLEIIAKFSNLPVDLLQTMCWPGIRPSGEIEPASIDKFQQWAISRGYMEEAIDINVAYDGSFVAAANSLIDAE